MTGPACELVVATGDPQGVGPEVSVRAAAHWAARPGAARLVLCGDPAVLDRAGADRSWPRIAVQEPAREPVSVLSAPAPEPLAGKGPSASGGSAALAQLERALERVRADPSRALVTAPVSKAAIRSAGVAFEGHTGWLASRLGVAFPVMVFLAPGFRVALATVHVALKAVPEVLDGPRIVRTALVLAADLERRCGIATPRIDVLGLNPHAGEGGAFGDEEERVIAPAIAALRARGLDVRGPHPADAYFRPGFGERADAVIALYHDQGLVAVKALAFRAAVNVTFGLPIVRTSVDHGTAFDIAWTGAADPVPMEAALARAEELLLATRAAARGDIPPAARAGFDPSR